MSNKRRNCDDEKILNSLNRNYGIDFNLSVEAIYNLPRILLNRAREQIKSGNYAKAKLHLDSFENLEKIILKENFPYSNSQELRKDFRKILVAINYFEKRYGPERDYVVKEKRSYE